MTSLSEQQPDGGSSVWKGMVAGALAGASAGWIMERFQTKLMPKIQHAIEGEKASGNGGGNGGSSQKQLPAPAKAAQKVSAVLLQREISDEQAKRASSAMHYAMSTVTGAVYGALAEAAPRVTAGHGLAYGAAVWAVADEIAVPAFGLSKPPTQHPLPTHLYALGSHLVYGASLETLRHGIRRAM